MKLGNYFLNNISDNFINAVDTTLNVSTDCFRDYMIPYYQFDAILDDAEDFNKVLLGWFNQKAPQLAYIRKALEMEYNPIENYNSEEEETVNTNGYYNFHETNNYSVSALNNTGVNTANNFHTNTYNGGYSNVASGGSSNSADGGSERVYKQGSDNTTGYNNSISNVDVSPYEGSYYNANKTVTNSNVASNIAYNTNVNTVRDLTSNSSYSGNDNTSFASNVNTAVSGTENTVTNGILNTNGNYSLNTDNTYNTQTKTSRKKSGNVGVTTTQQMIEAEIQLRKFLLMDEIKDDIIRKYTVAVY